MESVEERIKKLRQEPSMFKSGDIEELFSDIGDDIDKCIDVWRLTPPDVQRGLSKIYERLMQNCRDDIYKQTEIWINTSSFIQTKHSNDFETTFNSLKNLISNTHSNSAKRMASIKFIRMISNTENPNLLNGKEDSVINMCNDILDENSSLANGVFNLLIQKSSLLENNDLYSECLKNSIIEIIDEYRSSYNFLDLVNMYGKKNKLDKLLNENQELNKSFESLKEEMIKRPDEIIKNIAYGKLEIIDRDIFECLNDSKVKLSPDVYIKMFNNLLDNSKSSQGSNMKEFLYDVNVTPELFRKINLLIRTPVDRGETCGEAAFELLNLEMKFFENFKENPEYRLKINKTIELCKKECLITGDYEKFISVFKSNKVELEEYIEINKRKPINLDKTKDWKKVFEKAPPKQLLQGFGKDIINDFGIDIFCSAIDEMQKSGEDVSKYLDGITINASQLKQLNELQNIPEGLKVSVVCKNASEISVEDIDKINGKFECMDIRFDDINLGDEQKKPYTIQQYKMCRARIDEVLKDIILPPEEDVEREKKIFGQVIARLANITYNNGHVNLDDSIKKAIHMFDKMSPEDKERNKETIDALRKARRMQDFVTSRNMIGGLLEETCVCAGYAEIVRNVLSCCGIEARYVQGYDEKPGGGGHAWNQVKLDGEWFNLDLTWSAKQIKNHENPCHLLVNDQEFNNAGRHGIYSGQRGVEEKCNRTIQPNELKKYLFNAPEKGISYKDWLEQAAMQSRTGKIKEMDRILHRDMNMDREGGKTNDKESRDR